MLSTIVIIAIIAAVIALPVLVFILFIKLIPFLLKLLLYTIFAMPAFVVCHFIPSWFDELAVAVIVFILAVVKSFGSRKNGSYSSESSSGNYHPNYILNRRSGVIFNKWDSAADTISSRNKREISSSDAWSLVERHTKYRFKK